jgi:hypothetical protein
MSKSALSEVEEFEVQPILCIAGVLVIAGLAGLFACALTKIGSLGLRALFHCSFNRRIANPAPRESEIC